MNTHTNLKLIASAILTPVIGFGLVGCENFYADTDNSNGSNIEYGHGFPGTNGEGTSLSSHTSPIDTYPWSQARSVYTDADVDAAYNGWTGTRNARTAAPIVSAAPQSNMARMQWSNLVPASPAPGTVVHASQYPAPAEPFRATGGEVVASTNYSLPPVTESASVAYIADASRRARFDTTLVGQEEYIRGARGTTTTYQASGRQLIIGNVDVGQAQRYIDEIKADPAIIEVRQLDARGQDHFTIDVIYNSRQIPEGLVERVGNIIANM